MANDCDLKEKDRGSEMIAEGVEEEKEVEDVPSWTLGTAYTCQLCGQVSLYKFSGSDKLNPMTFVGIFIK